MQRTLLKRKNELKRLFDLGVAVIGLIICIPIIAVLGVLIRWESQGPAIFSQVRVGRNGRVFRCYKLRTMVENAPNVPTHHANHIHVTRLGSMLRRSKLDELPQLWNIIRGEMSFVGPRPCLPSQKELIIERQRRGVLSLLPGITGLSQVNGIDMSDPVLLAETDAKYLSQASFLGDLRIILQTVFLRKGSGDRVRNI
ncbi:O-antigen biosynthesis protein WbqP [Aminobacter sp. J15]|nr:O-antigen biosynthesis protein WbqP [Aminobacter sp. J15]